MRIAVKGNVSGDLPDKISHRREDSARKAVARFSRGNIRLQQGKYLTQEDIDARLRRGLENARKHGD